MLNGDISNRSSESIAVMCMDNLIFMKKMGILERISTSIMGRFFTAKFDYQVKDFISYVYSQTPYTVDLVVFSKDNSWELKKFLECWDVPYNRIIVIDHLIQLNAKLRSGDITYYVDNNATRRSRVNHKWSLSLAQISAIIKKQRN